MIRLLTCVLISVLILAQSPTANGIENKKSKKYRNRTAEGYWQTERAAFLDAHETYVALKKALQNDESAGSNGKPDLKTVSGEISKLLLSELASEKGVHVETALTALGAMTGFACQMVIRDGFVATGKISAEAAFKRVSTRKGRVYFFGPLLNECLVTNKEGQISVWGLVGGALKTVDKPQPDITAIFKRTAANMGGDDYGKPDIPYAHFPNATSRELLWKYWNVTRNLIVANKQDIKIWAFLLAYTGQQLIISSKDVIDPTLAAQIFMEAAIPMSKIRPKGVHKASIVDE